MARSENWRINKSSVLAIEGAQILQALKKVAGAAGLPRDFTVKFSTQETVPNISFEDNEMLIGAGRLFGDEAPISPEKFDVLVGMTLHETGHHSINTGNMGKRLRQSSFSTGAEWELLQKFANIGEDIVIETKTLSNPNLSDYEKSLHDWAVARLRPATPNKLMEVWVEYALGHKTDTLLNLPTELLDAMNQLVALTTWLRGTGNNASPAERATAYARYWQSVKDLILHPPEPPAPEPESEKQEQSPEQQDGPKNKTETEQPPKDEPDDDNGEDLKPEPDGTNTNEEEDDGEDLEVDPKDKPKLLDSESEPLPGAPEAEPEPMEVPYKQTNGDLISKELADEIDAAIKVESEDVTEMVEEALNMETRHPIIRSREFKMPKIVPDRILAKQLQRILTIQKRLQSRNMHGEQYGKIDKRHLYRVGTDERVFSLKYKFPSGFPECRILLDLSGSMTTQATEEVLQAAGALSSVVDAQVWGYRESNVVDLVRLDDGKWVHQFHSDGGTPSGLAITGVSMGMRRGGLVIHLTDGGHNVGVPPWNAHWALQKRGVSLINLIWRSRAGDHHQAEINRCYGFGEMTVRKLNGLQEFPDALYRILVEQMKLNGIGGR